MNGNLTEFSREVKAQFFETFPLLLNLEYKITENEENTFCIEIKAPSSSGELYLMIDTSGEEVTVSFGSYHAHYNDLLGQYVYGSAVGLINKIISSECAIVTYWREDKWFGSSLLNKENFPIDNENQPYASKIEIRSWLGNFDIDIECVPRN